MNGTIHLAVTNRVVHYELTFRHNISVIRGDSGTGKTALCAMLIEEGVQIYNPDKVKYMVMPRVPDWQLILENTQDTLIFFDETHTYINTAEFSRVIKHTSNYYVFITREDLVYLPYSVSAVYELTYSGKYGNQQTIIQNRLLYPKDSFTNEDFNLVITEDTGTGKQFWDAYFRCCSIGAGSNSNILKTVQDCVGRDATVLIIVDGAAFGAFFAKLDEFLHVSKLHALLLMPESFEWILLHHFCFQRDARVAAVLNAPEDYIDYRVAFSFEQFFYTEFIKACSALNISYSKGDCLAPTF